MGDDSITYSVPVGLAEAYRGRSMVVRASHPSEITRDIPTDLLADISYVRLSSIGAEVDELVHWGVGVPVDVVMRSPLSEFTQLYRYAKLLENHPVRISIPVVDGFSRAARLALALNFAVKLEMTGPPGRYLIDELHEVLSLYLYRPTVAQPVEFFHTLFLSFYTKEPATLWGIQEEDPAHFRYVGDDGEELNPRSALHAVAARPGQPGAGTAEYRRDLLVEGWECAGCEFFAHCGGYFKWPARTYDCAGVKTLFGALKEAAAELRGDVETFAAAQGEARA